jgi:hypothetical protein
MSSLKIVNNRMLSCGLGVSDSGQGPLANSYEQRVKSSNTIKFEVIFYLLRIIYILKKGPALWSCLVIYLVS